MNTAPAILHRLFTSIARLGLILVCPAAGFAADPVKIVVKDDVGEGKPVGGIDVYKFPLSGKAIPLGKTEPDGTKTLPDGGQQGEEIKPVSLHYAAVGRTHCPLQSPGPVTMIVHPKPSPEHASFILNRIGQPACAAYVEDVTAEKTGNPQVKAAARKRTLEYFGKFLGVPNATKQKGFDFVPSEEMETAIAGFQKKHSIGETGWPDQWTLKQAAEESLPKLPQGSGMHQELMLYLKKTTEK
jgi:hypothetical protein